LVVDPFKNDQMPNLNRLYQDRRQRDIGQSDDEILAADFFPYAETFEFNTTHFTSERDALRALQRAISEYQDERRGPTVILTQTPKAMNAFISQLRILGDFPVVAVASNRKDNTYPALDWQRVAGRRMLGAFCASREVLYEKLVFSRFSNIPLGNGDADVATYLSDLFFARLLTERDILLWYSPTERPDLGGREDDDNQMALEEIVDPELNMPGLYSTICVEYDISDLPMNTILQSTFINELEGADGYAGLSHADMSSLDEHMQKHDPTTFDSIDPTSPSYHAFKCLKDLVRGWAKEANLHNNVLGQLLLKNFYRWISSPSSKMYDPSLYGYLHGLMKKLLMQLLAEFKRLGSKIVFANFNKIIIVTTKTSQTNAASYSDFIIKTIKKKEIFLWIDLKPVHYWDQLLWMDSTNYGGVLADPEAQAHPPAQVDVLYDDMEEPRSQDQASSLSMEWNINRYLPPKVQQYFSLIVGEFIVKFHELKVTRRSKHAPGETPVRGIPTGMSASQVKETDSEVHEERMLVRTYFTRKLLQIVPEIQLAMTGVIDTEEEAAAISFPQLPGSYLKFDNPALELIKFICEVFGLARELEHEVRIMRRALLNLISIREFSPEAEFQNPCESFVLPHVICTFCQHCRDLDLSRDSESTGEGDAATWSCPHCASEYDKLMIEALLVDHAQRTLVAYQLQDLICSKCRAIKMENVRPHCKTCAGAYQLVGARAPGSKMSAARLVRKARTLQHIAQHHRMPFLSEVMDSILTFGKQ
jgi:DNA polymerase epsilon subunit 1